MGGNPPRSLHPRVVVLRSLLRHRRRPGAGATRNMGGEVNRAVPRLVGWLAAIVVAVLLTGALGRLVSVYLLRHPDTDREAAMRRLSSENQERWAYWGAGPVERGGE